MNIQGLDKALCEKRNRIVARKEAVEGVPVRLLASGEQAVLLLSDSNIAAYEGAMPTDTEEALALINAKLPEGAAELTADDVYIHYLEAANDNFIGDRYMFLGESTLRNIAADAGRGFAFMNSHRTGSLSQESELPFGKTFAGQYQEGIDEQGKPQKRAMVAFYMLRGVKPNGENGPTTDDLHKMIVGGQVADVSVGLHGGEALCDVCGVNLRETDCAHAPGTRRGMSDEQISQQLERGVTQGRASYTLNDARCGEVSAVFDGAVPGAGVKKVMSLRRKGKLNHREWKEARAAFGALLNGDLSMDENVFNEVAEAVETGVRAALADSATATSDQSANEELKREQASLREELNAQASQLAELLAQQQPSEPAALQETNQQGVELMATEKEPVVATSDSADTANHFAELNAQMATMRAELASAKELQARQAEELAILQDRNARLEADAQNARFTAEVEGAVRGGVRWFGDHAKHKTMLQKLASAFGEESAEVKQYIEQNRAFAMQLGASEILKEYGRDGNAEELTALEELQAKANEIKAVNPKLSAAQAFDQATQLNPILYDRYVKETRGGK